MKLFDQDVIPELFATITDSVLDGAEKLDLFTENGVLDAVPFGKIIKFLTKKIITIDDPTKALKKSIQVAGYKTLVDALYYYDLNPTVGELFLVDELPKLRQKITNYNCDVEQFDIQNFSSNSIITFLESELLSITHPFLREREQNLVSRYLKENYKLTFLKLIDENSVSYEKLNRFFDSAHYIEAIKNYRYELYRQRLKDQFHEVVLNDPNGMRLSDIYVEPGYAIHKSCFEEKDKRLEVFQDNENDKGFISFDNNSIHDFVDQFIKSRTDPKLKSKNARILFLLGYPGQGKSSFCKKLLNDCIGGKRAVDRAIFFVKFRSITDTNALINSPIGALENFISDRKEFDFVKETFENGVLILDGLDELFMKENMQSTVIDEFCRLVLSDIKERPNLKVVITSRYGYINLDRLRSDNSLVAQLNEFSLPQQQSWLSLYKTFHPESPLTIGKLDEIHKSHAAGYLKELIGQPILLHMVASLSNQVDLETNRAAIYDNLFTQLIERSWDDGQIDNLKGLQKKDLRSFLRSVAFEIYISGKEYINKSTLINLPATKEFVEKLESQSLKDSLKKIMIAFYFQETKKDSLQDHLSEDRSDYAIEFLHKSLQEYLVAEKIWDAIQEFTDKTRGEKYVIDQEGEALLKSSYLFASRLLTAEIRSYTKEIILNDQTVNRAELCERMQKIFPYCLEKEFFPSGSRQFNSVKSAFYCFYGYWFVMAELQQNKNLIPETQKDNFSFFLNFLTGRETAINLSYQDLSTCFLKGVQFDAADLSHANFEYCGMDGCNFTEALCLNTSFQRAILLSANFTGTDLYNVNFAQSNLAAAVFSRSGISLCVFKNANLYGAIFEAVRIGNQIFEECDLSYTTFNGCRLRPSIFAETAGIKKIAGLSRQFVDKIIEFQSGRVIKAEDRFIISNEYMDD